MRFSSKLLIALLLCTPMMALGAWGQHLAGVYDAIGPVPKPHSQNVVHLEEFLNFTCPHCNNFREASKPLFRKYGKRLKATYVPVLFRGQSDAALRLYYIGERAGRGEEVKNLIFDATFRYGVDINDPTIVSTLAHSVGLEQQYKEQAHAKWVDEKLKQASLRADQFGIDATPTIVLDSALRLVPNTGMNEFVGNLDKVIGELLKKQG